MSDDAAPSTAALHAEVAAKLKRAGSLTIGVNGAAVGPSNKRPNRSNLSANGNSKPSASTTALTTAVGTGSSLALPVASGSARKLLHWSPEQWKAFEAAPVVGSVIAPAKILPIRAPLSSIYEIHYADEKATYAPSALMEKLLAASRGGPVTNVGLVIDASGSDYFLHDVKEWDDWDVQFVKLRVALPSEDAGDGADRTKAEDAMVQQFFEQVEKHKKSDIKDMDIAVFATDGSNGYNFVGFLVVSYLIEYCDFSLDAALKEYAGSVSPGVYARYYLERLYRKYFATLPSMASTVKCPVAPKWDSASQPQDDADGKIGSAILTEEDQQHKYVRKAKPRGSLLTHTGGSNADTTPAPTGASSSSPPTAPTYKPPLYIPPVREDESTRSAKRRKIRSWEDDVEMLEYGETLDTSSEEHRRVLSALEKLTTHEGFPGCETIPLTGTHIGSDGYKKRGCLTSAYFVTWRARGRRCMLFIAESGTYVVSRNTTFTKVNMKFPRRRAMNESHVNTLIDGIIVEDQDHDVKVARFLAFDIAFLEGTPVWQKKLEKRLQCLQNEIILPRKNDTTFDYATEPFRVRMKDHFKLSKTEYLLTKFVKDVTHEVDGVIFTPLEAPYNLGGFESDDPIFKFVASEGSGIPGLDGSISQRRLLQYIQAIPPK